jgi:hypothetical protein
VYAWYLDIATPHWDALIMGDYDFIMPVPWNRKWGITYSMTPFLTQQVGIFSTKEVPASLFPLFFRYIPAKIKYLEWSINAPEVFPCPTLQFKQRINMILSIDKPYQEIRAGYNPKAIQKLRKNYPFTLEETTDIHTVISLNRQWIGHKIPFTDSDYQTMETLMTKAAEKGHLIASVLRNETGDILAAAVCLTSHGRVYLVLESQNEAGKKQLANHFFIDLFIRKYCQTLKIFDFQGSMIPGVASFFQKWGSIPQYYQHVKYARFPINLIPKYRRREEVIKS